MNLARQGQIFWPELASYLALIKISWLEMARTWLKLAGTWPEQARFLAETGHSFARVLSLNILIDSD
jgi:hypothetical protein